MIRALVCDDEALVRSELAYALRGVEPEIEIAESADALEALAELRRGRFDVIFLDVRMPGLSGLDAMNVIAKAPNRPHVVFVSAHETHAVDAFEHAALDYLLKPVSRARLSLTLARLRAALAERANGGQASSALPERLPVIAGGRTRLVRLEEIRLVRADARAAGVVLFEETVRFRGSLRECESRLRGRRFLRVHRGYIVNLDRVVEVNPFFGGTYVLRVDDRAYSEVPVSRSYVRAMRAALGV